VVRIPLPSPRNGRVPIIFLICAAFALPTTATFMGIRPSVVRWTWRSAPAVGGPTPVTPSTQVEGGVKWTSTQTPLYLVVRLQPDLDIETRRYLDEITLPKPTIAVRGESLHSLTRWYYGHSDDELDTLVETVNQPFEILTSKNEKTLKAGQEVLLPAAPRWTTEDVAVSPSEYRDFSLDGIVQLKIGSTSREIMQAVQRANPSMTLAWDKPITAPVLLPWRTNFAVYKLKTSDPQLGERQATKLKEMSHRGVSVAEVTPPFHVVPYWSVASAASANTSSPTSALPARWPFQSLQLSAAVLEKALRSSVVVAILDTGLASNDPRFGNVLWTHTPGKIGTISRTDTYCINDDHGCNFLTLNSFPEDDCRIEADFSHGTHMAGLVSGRLSGISRALEKRLQLMILKIADVKGEINPDGLDNAIAYSRRHIANIVNMSLTGQGNTAVKQEILSSGNILFVAAAGNSDTGKGVNLDDKNIWQTGFPATLSESGELMDDNVVSVAAGDGSGDLASFSNWGPSSVDLAAPGYDVQSTVMGRTTRSENGTSQATALVSLAAALLYSMGITKPADIKYRLIASCDFPKRTIKGVLSGGELDIDNAIMLSEDLVVLKDRTVLHGTIEKPTQIDLADTCGQSNTFSLGDIVKRIILHTADAQTARVLYLSHGRIVPCDGISRIGHIVRIETAQGLKCPSEDQIAGIIPAEPSFRSVPSPPRIRPSRFAVCQP
jgi:subtilase family protein